MIAYQLMGLVGFVLLQCEGLSSSFCCLDYFIIAIDLEKMDSLITQGLN